MAVIEVIITSEDLNEGGFESAIKDGVDNGVDSGGDVAQPKAHVGQVVRHLTLWTSGKIYVEGEERRPAYNKRKKHKTKDF